MISFNGFNSEQNRPVSIYSTFFSNVLPEIDHLAELKVILYAFWFLEQIEEDPVYLTYMDLAEDSLLLKGLAKTKDKATALLNEGLERCVHRGTLIKVQPENSTIEDATFFINTKEGQDAAEKMLAGLWMPDSDRVPISLTVERPNVFNLYEANIGPLTPMIAETIMDAEETYPVEWIEKAIQIAVENNARSWRYIEKILQSWQENGPDGKNRQTTQEDSRKYTQGKYGDIGEF
jgi:DnaD/phage-associated family protein